MPLLRSTCENCGEPGIRICSDAKPMFEQESRFLEAETGIALRAHGWEQGLWMRRRTVWLNGYRVLQLSAKGKPDVVKEYPSSLALTCQLPLVRSETLYNANKSSLDELEEEAVSFIRDIVDSYPSRTPVVSFSGGKDSTVVSHIVRRALGPNEILHIFGNTTMEYPDTLEYIAGFRRRNPTIPFLENSSDVNFLDMCRLIGPPSRINAWCCSVFKASPIAAMVSNINGQSGIISFEGIRRRESHRRRNRDRTYWNKKVVRQLSAYPILDWREVEIWLFILGKGLDFNMAYRKGFARVGCMHCPNNVPSSEYLIQRYYPSEVRSWLDFLREYAKGIRKEDISDYVSSGAWKMRVGKSNGQSPVYVRKVPCLRNQNAMHFILDKQLDDSFPERFKPFGKLDVFSDDAGSGFLVRDSTTEKPLFIVKVVRDIDLLARESTIDPAWNLSKQFICVDLLTDRGHFRLMQTIERQLRKLQVCVLCGACAGVCPTSAIQINPRFRIDAARCVHCGRCLSTRYIKAGCVSLNSQQQARGYSGVDRF